MPVGSFLPGGGFEVGLPSSGGLSGTLGQIGEIVGGVGSIIGGFRQIPPAPPLPTLGSPGGVMTPPPGTSFVQRQTLRTGVCEPADPKDEFEIRQPGDFGVSPNPCLPRATTRTVFDSVSNCPVRVDVWAPPRRKPRRNPFNPRANARAASRLASFARAKKRIEKAVRKACR